MDPRLRGAVAAATGREVVATAQVHGGDMAQSFRAELTGGGSVFVKTKPGAPLHFFTTEAAGLSWLRDGLAGVDGIAVPEVRAVSDDDPNHLVLEWIDEGRGGDEATFGRGLAALHRAGAPAFGREDRRTTGSRGLPNDPCATWAEFYATQRLVPLARLARDEGALAPATTRALEQVAARLGELGGPPEPPARLHGDLWAGNRLVGSDGRHWLIDPAAHGGHREFDLAMMALFGGFGPDAVRSYDEAFPLADGWESRVELHQIAPLVVHAVKFGGGYVAAATRVITRYS